MSLSPWTAVAVAVLAFLVIQRFIGGRKVAPNIVLEKIKAGAKVVDVRSPEEFREGAYPGAVNIPVQSLMGRLSEIPKDRPVVLYCASGARSGMAAQLLKRAGYTDVVNAGGLSDMPA